MLLCYTDLEKQLVAWSNVKGMANTLNINKDQQQPPSCQYVSKDHFLYAPLPCKPTVTFNYLTVLDTCLDSA